MSVFESNIQTNAKICNHTVKILWCNDGCWEAKGLSSREIESHMLGLTPSTKKTSYVPIDHSDFSRCIVLLKNHPEWKERLHEMKAYGYTWSNLVDHWEKLENLYLSIGFAADTKVAIDEFYQEIKSLNEYNGKITPFVTSDSVKTSELYIGSLVPHPDKVEEVMGLDPFVVFDAEPYTMVPIYSKGSTKAKTMHRLNVSIYTRSEDFDSLPQEKKSIMNSIINSMCEIAKTHNDFMSTITFNKCPVYKLGDEKEDVNEMFFANIYDKDLTEKIGCGLYLIAKTHPLHPSNSTNQEIDIMYEGVNWTVSRNPINLYELYEEGLINA